MSDIKNYACRICGYMYEGIGDDLPWGSDSKSPTYNFCICCGVEFGYQDSNLETIHDFREKWKNDGMKWDAPEFKPLNWDWSVQEKNIEEQFK